MFCSRCGTEVQQGTQFCPTCGLDLRITSPVDAIATGDVAEADLVREALSQEYELLEELGRGGMAIVYRARERQLEREVAIKVLPFALGFDADYVERFTQEGRTAAQLEHPNIVPVYRVGKNGRVLYFVMKMLRGGGLSKVLVERGKLTPGEIRRLLTEVGSALGYAHARGFVHRDIKPDNIMFDEFGQCVVTDFGIAKGGASSRLTGTGMSIGTPHYMSPEQARAQSVDGRSDLYSLGVVAYQALVGAVPYEGEDSFSIGYKHIMEPIPVPLLDTPEERRLFEIIKRLLMKDPYDRYQTADELLKALEGQPQGQVAGDRRLTAAQVMLAGQTTTPLPAAGVPLAPLGQARPRASAAGPVSPPPRPVTPTSGSAAALPGPEPHRPGTRRAPAVEEPPRAGWFAWLLALVVMGGFGAGGWYLYRQGALGGPVPADSGQAPAAGLPDEPESGPGHDTLPVGGLPPADSAVSPDPVPATRTGEPGRPSGAPAEATPIGLADSGTLRLVALPRGSNILIDNVPITRGGSELRLAAGWHRIGITAPGHELYKDSVDIPANRVLPYTPVLQPIGRPAPARPPGETPQERAYAALGCEAPSAANRYGLWCYDEPPHLASYLVPPPAGVTGTPSTVVLFVRVSSEGRTLAIQPKKLSNDSLFSRAVVRHVQVARWIPAQLDGRPIEGWTQAAFSPAEAP